MKAKDGISIALGIAVVCIFTASIFLFIHGALKGNSVEELEADSIVENIANNAKKMIEQKEKEKIKKFYLSDKERKVVECMVMGESGGEPYDGQVLVAQCILNACLKDGIQPSEVRTKYKYSGWNDKPSTSVKKAVGAVFDDGYKVTDEPILYFYAYKYTNSKWHESQQFVIQVGGHRFFKEKNS